MILDHINNYNLYEDMHNEFKNAFEFVNEYLKSEKPDGKYEINENVYAIVTSYETVLGNSEFETHQKYIDGQFIVKGKETIKWADKTKLNASTDYDSQDDFALHTGETQAVLKLNEGDFAIFYPNDAHMPGCAYDNKCESVKKIIVKIKVNE